MPKAFIILCAIGWSWTAVAGIWFFWRGRFSDYALRAADRR
jgi:hypothetical protein